MVQSDSSKNKRKYLEAEEDIANSVKLYCFLRDLTVKQFVTQTMKKELQPYDSWLENIKQLKAK